MDEKYYEIVDRPSSEVNKAWKVWHLFFITICIASGLGAAVPFAVVKSEFSETCFLYPNISYTVKEINGTNTDQNVSEIILIDKTQPKSQVPNFTLNIETRWGDDWICDYVQFVPFTSLILGSVLAAFFLMYPRGGTNYSSNYTSTRAWHLVVPSMIVSLIYSIVVLVSLLRLSNGVNQFCDQFLGLIKPGEDINSICPEIMIKVINDIKSRMHSAYLNPKIGPNLNINLAVIATTICLVSWVGLCSSLLLRIINVVDFKILETTVKKSNKDNTYKPLEKSTTTTVFNTDSDEEEEDETIIVMY